MPRYTASEFERILTFVRERRADRAQQVTIGRPKTWDEYQRDIAYIKAMDDVESEMARITGTEENPTEKDV